MEESDGFGWHSEEIRSLSRLTYHSTLKKRNYMKKVFYLLLRNNCEKITTDRDRIEWIYSRKTIVMFHRIIQQKR